jgi:hypothetical protein
MLNFFVALAAGIIIGMIIRIVFSKSKKTPSQISPNLSSAPDSICPDCGATIEAGAGYCTNCSAKLK